MTDEKNQRERGVAGILLALFVNAGSIKANPLLAWVPADLTVILGALLAVFLVVRVLRAGHLPHLVWLPIGVAGVMALGLLPRAINPYGLDKAESFFTLTLLAMLAAAVFLRSAPQLLAFLKTLAILGVIVALLVTLMPARVSEWSTVVTLAGTNTIATSRMILTGAIIIVMAAILTRTAAARRIGLAALAGLMILAALNTGSRGPVLAAAIAVTLALLVAPVFARRRGRAITAVVIVAGAGLIIASQSEGGGLARITSFLAGEEDASAGTRQLFWAVAWDRFTATPGGLGWGAFANINAVSLFAVDGVKLYPHNLILEVLLEAGWVAGMLVGVLLIASLIRGVKGAVSYSTVTMLGLLIFTVLNAMLSGDINDNRLMWTVLIGVWAVQREKAPTLPEVGKVGASSVTRA